VGEICPARVSSNFFLRLHRFAFASLLFVLGVAGAVITYRITRWQTVAIGFMSAPFPHPQSSTNVVHARAWPRQERIHAISIRCRGELDGVGALTLVGTSSEYVFSNKFDLRIDKRDWYSPNCNIVLTTTNVQNGSVIVSYQFHD